MAEPAVAVLDYGSGNIHSAAKALEAAGARVELTADRSRVLNFYWMFVALITGVYTFGLAGILLGPILIGLLKAVIDTVTARSSWQILELEEADDGVAPMPQA